MNPIILYAIVSASCFTVGLIGIVCLMRFWRFERGVDVGDGVRKKQEKPVIRLGGLPLYAVFVTAFLFSIFFGKGSEEFLISFSFLILGTVIFLMGICDDLFDLSAKVKILIQIGVA
ncbi:MAG: hypothetical protein AAGA96_11980, partial [Verrucomicrobiota bacterium]